MQSTKRMQKHIDNTNNDNDCCRGPVVPYRHELMHDGAAQMLFLIFAPQPIFQTNVFEIRSDVRMSLLHQVSLYALLAVLLAPPLRFGLVPTRFF